MNGNTKTEQLYQNRKMEFSFCPPPHKWTDIMTVTAMIGRCITQKH